MPKQSKKYNIQKINPRRAYLIKDIVLMFGVTKRSVGRWINKEGLPIIEGQFPYWISGEELRKFIEHKISKRKCRLQNDEFFCVKCRRARKGIPNSIKVEYTKIKMGKTKMQLIKT